MRSVWAEPGDGTPLLAGDRLAWVALLVVAAGIRAYAWAHTAVLFNDGPIFLAMAEAIDAGRWAEVLAHPFHPLYPALIALIAQTSIDFESAGIIVSIAGGLLSIVGVFVFVRRAFGRDLAWLAAWTVALHPWAVDFSSDVMSDGLYGGLYLLGFAAMASLVDRPRLGPALACGIAAGLAYLTRPEGIGLLLVCGLLLAARAVVDRSDRKRLLLAGAGLALAAGIVMAPFLVSIARTTGEFRLTQKKSLGALVTGNANNSRPVYSGVAPGAFAGDDPIPLPRSSEQVDGSGAIRPPRTLVGFAEAISRAGRTSLAALRYEVAAFALLGLWTLRARWRFLREATVALPAVLYTGVLVLLVWGAGYVARRHALAALLPICAYAAIGWRTLAGAAIDRVFERNPERAARLKSPTSICLLLVVTLCVVWGARDLRPRRMEREPLRLAAEWLKVNASPASPVAAQKLRVAYYAGADYVPLPSGNDEPMEEYLRKRGVRWVVIDDTQLDDHRGLAAGLGKWLIPIHSIERSGRMALVLELRTMPAS